jgi:hypothetical protein
MKKLILAMASLALAAMPVFAGPALIGPVYTNNINTNTSVTTTLTAIRCSGEFEGIYVDLSGATTPTVTVSVATLGSEWTGPSRTFITTNITADAYLAPRALTLGTVGEVGERDAYYPLYEDTLIVKLKAITVTNVNVKAYLFVNEND